MLIRAAFALVILFAVTACGDDDVQSACEKVVVECKQHWETKCAPSCDKWLVDRITCEEQLSTWPTSYIDCLLATGCSALDNCN